MKPVLFLILACLFLTQCSSPKSGTVVRKPPVTHLYIVKNGKVQIPDLEQEMLRQVLAMGISAELVDTAPTDEAYFMVYTAHSSPGMEMHLSYLQADLRRGDITVSGLQYKANSADMVHVAPMDETLRSLLRQLILGERPVRTN